MQPIQSILIGRLNNSADVNGGIAFSTNNVNFVPCIQITFVSGAKYLIVVKGLHISYEGQNATTFLGHYEFSSISGKWNLLDANNIDTDIFPNIDKLVTDSNTLINIQTGKITNTSDNNAYNITRDANGTIIGRVLKSNYTNFSFYLRFNQIGISLETAAIQDLYRRFLPFLVR